MKKATRITSLLLAVLFCVGALPFMGVVADTKTETDILSAATAASTLPFDTAITYTDADAYTPSWASSDVVNYAVAYKLSLTAGDQVDIAFVGPYDTYLDLYEYDSEADAFVGVDSSDSDALDNLGERWIVVAPETKDYYLLASTYENVYTNDSYSLKIRVTGIADAVELDEYLAAVTPTPLTLPVDIAYSTSAQQDTLLAYDGAYYLARAYSFAMEKDQVIGGAMEGAYYFTGNEEILICQGTTVLEEIDYTYAPYEEFQFTVPQDGTYTFVLLCCVYSEPAEYSLKMLRIDNAQTFQQLLDGATAVTTTPYTDLAALSFDIVTDTESTWLPIMAKAYKVDVAAGQSLDILATDTADADTADGLGLAVYTHDGEQYHEEYYTDLYNEEYVRYTPDTAETVYVVLGKTLFDTTDVHVSLTVYDVDETLDFSGETDPVPGPDDLWDWSAGTKTLTLNDGFSLFAGSGKNCIILPSGMTTLRIHGEVTLNSEYAAIYSQGDLNIEMADGAVLRGFSMNGDALSVKGELTIEGKEGAAVTPKLLLTALDVDGIDAGEVVLSNIELDIKAGSDGIYADEITAENSQITVRCYDQGLDAEDNIALTDCLLDIESSSDEALDSEGNIQLTDCQGIFRAPEDDGINAGESFVCSGGFLDVFCRDDAIDADAMTIAGTRLILESTEETVLEWGFDDDGTSLLQFDDKFALYVGSRLVYTGELTDALYGYYEVDDCLQFIDATYGRATKLVTGFNVTFYDEDGTTVLKDAQYVAIGGAAVPPADPTKAEDSEYTYTFEGWDVAFDNVTADLAVKAVYTASAKEITVSVPLEMTVVKGGTQAPGAQTFTVELLGLDGTPLDPELLAKMALTNTISTNGAGATDSTLTITTDGDTYGYGLSDGFLIRVAKGTADGWTYPDEFYYVVKHETVNIFAMEEVNGDYQMGEEPVDKARFTSTYTKNAVPDDTKPDDTKPDDTTPDDTTPDDTTPDDTTPDNGEQSPVTGENSQAVLWIALLFISGAALAGIVLYGKKKAR